MADGVLRACLDAGAALDAILHPDGYRFFILNLKNFTWTRFNTASAPSAFVMVYCNSDVAGLELFDAHHNHLLSAIFERTLLNWNIKFSARSPQLTLKAVRPRRTTLHHPPPSLSR